MGHTFYCLVIRVLVALCNLRLKSSAEILGENKARHLLKSEQNPEILINNMSVNMSDYFKNTFCIKRKSYFLSILKISTQILSIFKDIASYKFTKIRRDNGELPVYSLSA